MGGMAPDILGLPPNWKACPMKGGGVLRLKGGPNIGGPLGGKLGANGGWMGSFGCGGGVRMSILPHGLVYLVNGLGLFLLELAEKGFLPRLGPLPNLLLDSEGLWFRFGSCFFVWVFEVSSSDSSCFCFSFRALFALLSSSSSENSTWCGGGSMSFSHDASEPFSLKYQCSYEKVAFFRDFGSVPR